MFALSLRRCRFVLKTSRNEIVISIRAQLAGFLVLSVLASMELFFLWFNNEFVFVVPIVVLLEEVLVAHQFSRGVVAGMHVLPGTSKKPG